MIIIISSESGPQTRKCNALTAILPEHILTLLKNDGSFWTVSLALVILGVGVLVIAEATDTEQSKIFLRSTLSIVIPLLIIFAAVILNEFMGLIG